MINPVATTKYKAFQIKDQKSEFDLTNGTHTVLPNLRIKYDPVKNLDLALELLRLKARQNHKAIRIDSLTFGGYQDKEAYLNYTVIDQDELNKRVQYTNKRIDNFFS